MRKLVYVVLAFSLVIGLTFGCAPKPAKAHPIVLGVPTSLGIVEGADSLRSVKMAAEEINAKGGVLVGGVKRPFKVVSIDTRGDEPGIPVHDALAAVEKLILENKPHAIVVGAGRSEVLLASMDLIHKYKIPYICSIAASPKYQERIVKDYDKYKYCFRTCLNSFQFVMNMTAAMEYLSKEFGFKRAYIMVQDVLWARATGRAMEKWFKGHGWEVTGHDAYSTGATEFSSSLIRAKDTKAQVIAIAADMPECGILLKEMRAMKIPALPCGHITGLVSQNAWEVFEGEVEGMLELILEIGPIPVKAVPKSVEYNKAYGRRWGEDARRKLSGHGPGPSYDSVYILADAIERAGTLDPDAIVAALEKTDMMGVVGRIKFGKDHQVIYGLDPKETAIGCLFQWVKPGKRVIVFPEVVAEAKVKLPPYMK